MKDKALQQLIKKYLEGESTSAEERLLAMELQRPNISPECQAIRLMLGELTLGEAEYDAFIAQRYHKISSVIITMRIILSAAAVYLVGLFFWLQYVSEVPVNMIAQKHPIDDSFEVCTQGTPSDMYICYLEHKKTQPNTSNIIKQKLYENQR